MQKLLIFCCALIFSIILVADRSPTCAAQKRNILILNSYHLGFKWTDEQTQGIIESLAPQRDNLKIYIAHMDTKWAYDPKYFHSLHDTYKLKFKDIHFDIIFATDDDAFNFLRRYRDDTFGKVPVVFCGINWFKPEYLKGQTLYTGVNEDADIDTNINLMLKLHPNTKNIYMVVDMTTTGRIVHKKIMEIIPKYRDRVKIHFLDDMTMQQILAKVSNLPQDSLLFLTIYQKDNSGAFFEFSEIAELLSQNSSVPVYGLWDFYLGYGIVGGMLTSGHAQGSSAGALALRILKGESPDNIPVIMASPNKYLFDYQQLKRHGMLMTKLPDNKRVINVPPPSTP